MEKKSMVLEAALALWSATDVLDLARISEPDNHDTQPESAGFYVEYKGKLLMVSVQLIEDEVPAGIDDCVSPGLTGRKSRI